ncbi:unnamed protein product [Blepharisma stoltei]|uniref:Ubiquinone biosynthesis protein COQ4 homolog, mitochondrial n=1 Tax=Blepharisma stoltei TaxID=1481888 RepID=A0AAU9ISH5_9CILI|nr:unnamed protein product [Blepharisma stoltei]
MIRNLIRKAHTCNDILENFSPLSSETDRVYKIFTNAVNGLLYPENGEYLSTFGECSSYYALQGIKKRMQAHPVGAKILQEKPRIRTPYVDFNKLRALSPNTFGKQYIDHMDSLNLVPDERPLVKHIGDLDLAYIFQRYKEIHDFLHLLLSKEISVYEEIEVKIYEFQQLELASTALASLVGPLRLSLWEKIELLRNGAPKMISLANKGKFCMNVHYEAHFEQDMEEFKKWFFSP